MVIRAGVDDRQMTSALGVNIQLTFAIAFVVGSALAAFGGVVGASQGAVAPGQDGQWLLNSLVVVIIGGMGSLLGAAVGSLLYGLVVLVLGGLPADDRGQLLHPVLDRLHVRAARTRARLPAAGPLREILVTRDPKADHRARDRRSAVSSSLSSRPLLFSTYWVDVILTQTLIVGIAAASLIFLAAYGGMISLAADDADGHGRVHARQHGHEGRRRRRVEGAHARLGPDARRSCSRSSARR